MKDKIVAAEPQSASESSPVLAPNQKVFDIPKIKKKVTPLKLYETFLDKIKNEAKNKN